MLLRQSPGIFCAAAWETYVEMGKDDTNKVRNTEFMSSTALGSLTCHGKGKEGEKSYILTMKLSVQLLVQHFLYNRKFGTPNFALFPAISLQMPYIL